MELTEAEELFVNETVPGDHGFFTPVQSPPAGTAISMYQEGKPVPKIFKPITIRSTTFTNRIWVSPMCQYSSTQSGELTDWHLVQLGSYASRGASLTIVEATSVSFEGRNTIHDAGLWSDRQIPSFRRVVNFIHSQEQKVGIQLQHCGRKASVTAPWLGHRPQSTVEGGFSDDVIAPSAIPYKNDGIWPTPTVMTKEMIRKSIGNFVHSARLAVEAGFDVIEIHGAHGYLIHQFCSPLTNRRTDEYGGCFENRVRFALEVVKGIRLTIPETTLLFYRISATDWVSGQESWTLEQSVRLCQLLKKLGVDLIDVSSGGLVPEQNLPPLQPAFQAHLSETIKNAVPGLLTASVGMIRDGKTAEEILNSDKADAVMVAREFARNPSLVLNIGYHLGVRVKWPTQLHRSQPNYIDLDM
jgi:2,4-dienoyl-CoA reductase-like NADH-dependent reductase (Old Yellow Enzyme family)